MILIKLILISCLLIEHYSALSWRISLRALSFSIQKVTKKKWNSQMQLKNH